MSYSDVISCSIGKWYPTFRNDTFKSKLIEFEKDVLEYLHTDGIKIPDARALQSPENIELDKLINRITIGIEKLGGEVIPKFTWSVPCDAVWLRKTLKCTSAIEVILLLKSSNQITHDLDHSFDKCTDVEVTTETTSDSTIKNKKPIPTKFDAKLASEYFNDHCLCLRKWQEVDESKEFRCFVRSKNLIAISQRHPHHYFPELSKKLDDFKFSIYNFFEIKIKNKFNCIDYIFDVCIVDNKGVVLVDFNPYNQSTKSHLFTYEELQSLYKKHAKNHPSSIKTRANTTTENTQSETISSSPNSIPTSIPIKFIPIRCIQNQSQVHNPPFGWDAFPEDMLHVTKGLDPSKIDDFLKIDFQKKEDEDYEEVEDDDYDVGDEKYEGDI